MKIFTKISHFVNENIQNDFEFDENEKITDDRKMIYVGYWREEYNNKNWYGIPSPNWEGWDDKKLYETFLKKLKAKIELSRIIYYRGYSGCRICKDIRNGTTEYEIDDKYIMPAGYLHYIEKHKIKPHKWFLEYIMNSK